MAANTEILVLWNGVTEKFTNQCVCILHFFIDHDYYYLYRNCVIRYACGCTFYWIFYTLHSRPENFLDQDQKQSLVCFGLNNLCPWPSYGLCQVISLWLDLGCVTHRYSSCLHLLSCVTSSLANFTAVQLVVIVLSFLNMYSSSLVYCLLLVIFVTIQEHI